MSVRVLDKVSHPTEHTLLVELSGTQPATEPNSQEERIDQVVSQMITPTKQAFAQRLKVQANFSSPMAKSVVETQTRYQDNPNLLAVLPPSATHPHQTFVSPQSVRTVRRKLGQGTQGSVMATVRLFKDPVREQEQDALKIYQKRPSSWDLFSNFDESDKKFINLPTQVYFLDNGKYGAVLPEAEADFARINLSNEHQPIQRMFGWVRDVAEGTAIMHEKGILHRDIKPANILVLKGRETAQVADLDLSQRSDVSEHTTTCTPFYSHPSIWGRDIMKQKMRRGAQTPAEDVFSLGRTIQYGLIEKVFLAHPETKNFAIAMRPEQISLPEDEAEADRVLRELADSRPGPVMISGFRKIEDPRVREGYRYIPSKVDVFLPRDLLRTNTLQGVQALKGKLDPVEFEALSLSANWAHELQHDDPAMRPTMRDVQLRIERDQNTLVQPIEIVSLLVQGSSFSGFAQKRTSSDHREKKNLNLDNIPSDRDVKRAKKTKKKQSLV